MVRIPFLKLNIDFPGYVGNPNRDIHSSRLCVANLKKIHVDNMSGDDGRYQQLPADVLQLRKLSRLFEHEGDLMDDVYEMCKMVTTTCTMRRLQTARMAESMAVGQVTFGIPFVHQTFCEDGLRWVLD